MKRRQVLKYGTLGTASCLIAACQGEFLAPHSGPAGEATFAPLEKSNLTLGFLPVADAAPLIVAREKGLFARYGLTVNLSRQSTWADIEQGLLTWRFDAAQAPFALPLSVQLGAQAAPLISLMVLNLNGGAITLGKQAWQAGIRPGPDYTNFPEFASSFRDYLRRTSEPLKFATDSPISMDSYLCRYWLAAMGINPELEIEWLEFPPFQVSNKLQAGIVRGYCGGDPWHQQSVRQQAGFVPYTNRDIWQGHPSKVLAAMDGWVKKYPATARALVAALLAACQFCDRPENRSEVAGLLSQSQYLNLDASFIEPSLGGQYLYSTLAGEEKTASVPDFQIFHFQETSYLKPPNQANYPWRSQAIWVLTQMIRWHQLDLSEYPPDADQLLAKIYPVAIYEEVARALGIALPKEQMKIEPAAVFIDRRQFDPGQPVAYLHQFGIRA